MLAQNDQDSVTVLYDQAVQRKPHIHKAVASQSPDIPLDIESCLLRTERFFDLARYWHERGAMSWDSKGFGGTLGVIELKESVADLITEEKPDWQYIFKLTTLPLTQLPDGQFVFATDLIQARYRHPQIYSQSGHGGKLEVLKSKRGKLFVSTL